MNQHISKAHDHFFRIAMTDQRIARDFFEAHLPKELREAIDLNALELQPGSHIDDFRSEAITDMTFRTTIHGRAAYLQLFVEHQSSPDELMPFRIMDQALFLSLVRKELPSELGEKIMTVSEQLIAKGIEKGMHLAKLAAAHEMLLKGLDEAMIADITKLNLAEIRAEANKLKNESQPHH